VLQEDSNRVRNQEDSRRRVRTSSPKGSIECHISAGTATIPVSIFEIHSGYAARRLKEREEEEEEESSSSLLVRSICDITLAAANEKANKGEFII
jgi:acyl CoA:acetate/3-ketoacid CoA transferase alpha subunit